MEPGHGVGRRGRDQWRNTASKKTERSVGFEGGLGELGGGYYFL